MTTLSGALTLADWAKRVTTDFKIDMIIELLSKENAILQDMLFIEGNLPTGHKTTVRTGLPSGTWRLLNTGVDQAKSTTAQITEGVGNLELFLQVDKDLADLGGQTAAFRETEVRAAIQGLGQQVATAVMYGNSSTNPEQFMGLSPRYNTVTTTAAENAWNVLDASGTGSDNTSMWIVVWGPNTIHGIFPKGQPTGLQHKDLGAAWPVTDSNSKKYMAYIDHFKWELGIALRDWRYAVRICNIDVSDLATTSAANLLNLMVRALYRLPTTPMKEAAAASSSDAPTIQGEMGRTAIYCNRTVRTYLDLQAMNKSNTLLQLDQYDGMPITTFRGIPIKTVDAITNAETRVT